MKAKAVARPLAAAAMVLWVAALLSGAGAQPSSGTLPLLQSLVDLESVEVSVGGLAPALPQEALAPAVSGPGGGLALSAGCTGRPACATCHSQVNTRVGTPRADNPDGAAGAGQGGAGEGRRNVSETVLNSSSPGGVSGAVAYSTVHPSTASALSQCLRSFCTKPTVTRGQKVDTVIQGPQLNITLSGGNCSVAVDLGERHKTLACVGPSISYSKVTAVERLVGNGWAPLGLKTSTAELWQLGQRGATEAAHLRR